MSSPKQKSASRRYLKARLRILTRPEFWGGNLTLCVVLLFAWQYFIQPLWSQNKADNKQTANQQVTDTSKLKTANTQSRMTDEESAAIAADIDSSSVLEQELNIGVIPTPTNTTVIQPTKDLELEQLIESSNLAKQSNKNNSTQIAQTQLLPSSQNTQQQTFINPFAASAQKLLYPGVLGSNETTPRVQPMSTEYVSSPNSPLLSVGANNLNSSFNQNQSPGNLQPGQQLNSQGQITDSRLITNVSQQVQPTTGANTAIVPAYGQPSATGYYYPPQQTISTVQNSYTYLTQPQTINLGQNSYTYLTQPQSIPVVSTTVPATQAIAPVTPVPGAPNSAVLYAPQIINQPIGNNNYRSYSVGNSGVQPSQLNQPSFSVPRPVPGRYIGNGEINTFSNP